MYNISVETTNIPAGCHLQTAVSASGIYKYPAWSKLNESETVTDESCVGAKCQIAGIEGTFSIVKFHPKGAKHYPHGGVTIYDSEKMEHNYYYDQIRLLAPGEKVKSNRGRKANPNKPAKVVKEKPVGGSGKPGRPAKAFKPVVTQELLDFVRSGVFVSKTDMVQKAIAKFPEMGQGIAHPVYQLFWTERKDLKA